MQPYMWKLCAVSLHFWLWVDLPFRTLQFRNIIRMISICKRISLPNHDLPAPQYTLITSVDVCAEFHFFSKPEPNATSIEYFKPNPETLSWNTVPAYFSLQAQPWTRAQSATLKRCVKVMRFIEKPPPSWEGHASQFEEQNCDTKHVSKRES